MQILDALAQPTGAQPESSKFGADAENLVCPVLVAGAGAKVCSQKSFGREKRQDF